MAIRPPAGVIPPNFRAAPVALTAPASLARHQARQSPSAVPSAAPSRSSRIAPRHFEPSPLLGFRTAVRGHGDYAAAVTAATADGDAIGPTFSGASGAVPPLSYRSHDRRSDANNEAAPHAVVAGGAFPSRKPSLRPSATTGLDTATCDSSPLFAQEPTHAVSDAGHVTTNIAGAISSVLRLAPSANPTQGTDDDRGGSRNELRREAQRRNRGKAEQQWAEARAEDKGSLTDEEEEEGHARRVRLGKERRGGQPWMWGMSPAGQRAFRLLLKGADGESGKAERVLCASAEAGAESSSGEADQAERHQGKAGKGGRVDRWSRRSAGKAEKAEGGSPGEISAGDIKAILKGLGNKGRWRDALAVFHWARSCGKIGGSCAEGEEGWRERGSAMVSLVLRILSRCDRPNEADDFFRALQADGCALDVYAYTAMMSALSRAGRFNDAIALFRAMRAEAGLAPSIVTFNVALAAYARKRGCFHHMAALLQEMRAEGLSPDEYTYNTMISACADAVANEDAGAVGVGVGVAGLVGPVAAAAGAAGAPATVATAVPATAAAAAPMTAAPMAESSSDSSDSDTGYSASFSYSSKSYSTNSYSTSSHVTSSSAAQYIQEAERIFAEMRAAGLKPTRVTYNALLDVYGKAGHVALAHWVLESMVAAGVRPNLVTYNELISACGRRGQWREARGIVDTMLGEGGGAGEKKGEGQGHGEGKEGGGGGGDGLEGVSEGAVGGVQEQEDSRKRGTREPVCPPKPDVFSYTALIAAYGKAGQVEKVREIFMEMRQQGCSPNLFTFNTLLDIYGKSKLFADVAWVMDELAASGIQPDVVTWNTLIRCYGQAQMLPKVESTVEAMRRSGCRPNRRTYNGLIDAFGRCGSAADAAAVFEAMKRAGHMPNSATYIALLAAQSREGLWEQAEGTIDTMRRAGYAPDALAYSCLIHAYATAGDATRLLDAVFRLEATGRIPRSTSPKCPWAVHKTLVLAFCKCGCVGEAEEALGRMRGMGHVPDLVVWNAVLGMYGRLGRVERAEGVRGEMRREGVEGDVVTHNVMMSVYGREGMSERVEREMEGMKARGIAPDAVSYSSVVLTLCKVGRVQAASPYVAECETNGLPLSAAALNAFASACLTAARPSDAVRVLETAERRAGRLDRESYSLWMQALEMMAAAAASSAASNSSSSINHGSGSSDSSDSSRDRTGGGEGVVGAGSSRDRDVATANAAVRSPSPNQPSTRTTPPSDALPPSAPPSPPASLEDYQRQLAVLAARVAALELRGGVRGGGEGRYSVSSRRHSNR